MSGEERRHSEVLNASSTQAKCSKYFQPALPRRKGSLFIKQNPLSNCQGDRTQLSNVRKPTTRSKIKLIPPHTEAYSSSVPYDGSQLPSNSYNSFPSVAVSSAPVSSCEQSTHSTIPRRAPISTKKEANFEEWTPSTSADNNVRSLPLNVDLLSTNPRRKQHKRKNKHAHQEPTKEPMTFSGGVAEEVKRRRETLNNNECLNIEEDALSTPQQSKETKQMRTAGKRGNEPACGSKKLSSTSRNPNITPLFHMKSEGDTVELEVQDITEQENERLIRMEEEALLKDGRKVEKIVGWFWKGRTLEDLIKTDEADFDRKFVVMVKWRGKEKAFNTTLTYINHREMLRNAFEKFINKHKKNAVKDMPVYVVEKIVGYKWGRKNILNWGPSHYDHNLFLTVKWLGYGEEENTKESFIQQRGVFEGSKLLRDFLKEEAKRQGRLNDLATTAKRKTARRPVEMSNSDAIKEE